MKLKKQIGFVVIFIAVLLTLSMVSAYQRSYPQFSQFQSSGFGFDVSSLEFNDELCDEVGEDFIIQIAPFGCEPAVVRSDLLEEQNVPVFCQLAATKINPLIEVEAIESISFKGDYPEGIAGVGFQPARAALGTSTDLNQPILNNIGYVVIVLDKQENASSMLESIFGNLTAKIKYDIKNAFGIGRSSFYLPVIEDDSEWEDKKTQYSFWNSKGYLRADDIYENEATIALYDDTSKLRSITLDKGELSEKISLPGFDCLAKLQLKLDDLEVPDTRARLRVEGDFMEVVKGESFLNGKCRVSDIDKKGLVQEVSIRCKEDDKTRTHKLTISPNVSLTIDGVPKNYGLGAQLYPYDDTRDKFVYVGYIGMNKGGENFIITIVSTAKNSEDFMKTSIFKSVSTLVDANQYETGNIVVDVAKDLFVSFGAGFKTITDYIGSGDFISASIKEGETEDKITFEGFAGAQNKEISEGAETYYENAMQDYDRIINSYASESVEGETMNAGEKAFIEKISLADSLNQKETVINLCDEFKEEYSDKNLPSICANDYKLINSGVSSTIVFVNGKGTTIDLDGIEEPGFEEYGAEISVSGKEFETKTLQITKGIKYSLGPGESFELASLTEDSAVIQLNIKKGTVDKFTSIGTSERIKLGSYESNLGINEYHIAVNKINLKKMARVSVIPSIDNAGTEANFSFIVGIEKRPIELSPEKVADKIEMLNETINKWEERSNQLGELVKGLKTACLGVGAYLTVKNFFANVGGEGIARQEIMKYWRTECQQQGEDLDKCYSDNADNIEKDVKAMAKIIENQQEKIQDIQEDYIEDESGGLFGGKHVKTDEFMDEYSLQVKDNYDKVKGEGVEDIDESYFSSEYMSTDDARSIERYSMILQDDSFSDKAQEDAKKNMNSILKAVKTRNEARLAREQVASNIGVPPENVIPIQSEKTKTYQYTGLTKGKFSDINKAYLYDLYEDSSSNQVKFADVDDDAPVQVIETNGKIYYAELVDPTNSGRYSIKQIDGKGLAIYNSKGYLVEKDDIPEEIKYANFKRFTSADYTNKYISGSGDKDPVARYYETEPYRGLPAIVPFDLITGWYAATKQTLPIGGGVKAFEDSGRVSSFWLCNVGANGVEEFNSGSLGGSDDICELINLATGQPTNQFPGLSSSEASSLVKDGVKAIEQASSQYKAGVTSIKIKTGRGTYTIKVGNPAVDVPGMQCQDFMSPKDCKLLFNVCDPVTCPVSRCNFGGNYNVKDPIQTGIIGGLVLCLPNGVYFGGDVYVPLCLSGIKAGIDGLISVFKSYRDCLQESLDTGQMVGICDEIYSIHSCEFFWRQAFPLAKAIIPNLLSSLTGGTQATRGGGEYLSVQNAWDTAKGSTDYFVDYYGANAFSAFKSRSTEDVGSLICQASISGAYPNTGNLLDQLTEPDSPPQFHGRFDEIPFTTTTNPPTSQYKVFYHIYAGQGSRAYYKVYLKPGPGGSFYRDVTSSRIVASGYITTGEYASETKDFTAPTGYKELCISVNGQEECGFKEVSTSFAVNYAKDKHLEGQAEQTDITSTSECVSGSVSGYSLLSPSLEGSASELIDPAVYDRGLIRTCATANPGQGSDALAGGEGERWREVGYCDDQSIKCWLDTDSVEDIIKTRSIKGEVLSDLSDNSRTLMEQEGTLLTSSEFDSKIKEIDDLSLDNKGKVELITQILEKVFYNNQKARLLLRRADAHSMLARGWKQPAPEVEPEDKATTGADEHDIGEYDEDLEEGEEFSFEEKEVFNTIQGIYDCTNCGKFKDNYCDEKECNQISKIVNGINSNYECEYILLHVEEALCQTKKIEVEESIPDAENLEKLEGLRLYAVDVYGEDTTIKGFTSIGGVVKKDGEYFIEFGSQYNAIDTLTGVKQITDIEAKEILCNFKYSYKRNDGTSDFLFPVVVVKYGASPDSGKSYLEYSKDCAPTFPKGIYEIEEDDLPIIPAVITIDFSWHAEVYYKFDRDSDSWIVDENLDGVDWLTLNQYYSRFNAADSLSELRHKEIVTVLKRLQDNREKQGYECFQYLKENPPTGFWSGLETAKGIPTNFEAKKCFNFD